MPARTVGRGFFAALSMFAEYLAGRASKAATALVGLSECLQAIGKSI